MPGQKTVDQSRAKAGGDNVARDKTQIETLSVNLPPARPPGVIESLMSRLAQEISDDEQTKDQIDSLAFFYLKKSTDGIEGLEAKLIKADRHSELIYAIEQKEMFVKLLYKYSLYSSAQEIFAYLLARIDHRYRGGIEPLLGELDKVEINNLITKNIVEPIVSEVGSGVFTMNDAIAMGMLYWLAEQCFIRWHA